MVEKKLESTASVEHISSKKTPSHDKSSSLSSSKQRAID